MSYKPLFESELIKLSPVDVEKDSQVISAWTYDLEIARKLRDDKPARPMPVLEVKKVYEQWQKESEESNRQYLFALRRTGSDEIIGVARICYISWVHGAAYVDLIICEMAERVTYARAALDLILHYAFDELGLFRVTAVIPEHDRLANDLYQQASFTLEVRQRQAVYWRNNTWDKLYFGMLRPEWKMMQTAEVA